MIQLQNKGKTWEGVGGRKAEGAYEAYKAVVRQSSGRF